MKVNGEVFKKAREEIRKNAPQSGNKLKGEFSKGTQEWLAHNAKIISKNGKVTNLSVRTIQYLEKGTASIQVVDAVSPFLGLNGRELIFDYGEESVKLDAPVGLDFRPVLYPPYSEDYQKSPVMMSIDPLTIKFTSDDIETILVKDIRAMLKIGDMRINFKWLYEVSLTPAGNGWLGIKDEVYPFEMNAPDLYRSSIMLSQQEGYKLNWNKFIEEIQNYTDSLIQIKLTVNFDTFEKLLKIGISTSQICSIIKQNMRIKKSTFPFYLQPDALTWR